LGPRENGKEKIKFTKETGTERKKDERVFSYAILSFWREVLFYCNWGDWENKWREKLYKNHLGIHLNLKENGIFV